MESNDRKELAKLFANDLKYEIKANLKSGDFKKNDVLIELDRLIDKFIKSEHYEICIELVKIKKWVKEKVKDE